MFSHQDFENRTKTEGVMALTIKLSRNSQCRHHLRSDVLLGTDDFNARFRIFLLSGCTWVVCRLYTGCTRVVMESTQTEHTLHYNVHVKGV